MRSWSDLQRSALFQLLMQIIVVAHLALCLWEPGRRGYDIEEKIRREQSQKSTKISELHNDKGEG